MNIYEQYGKLMVEQEILQVRINEVKKKIAEELNIQQAEEKKEEDTNIVV